MQIVLTDIKKKYTPPIIEIESLEEDDLLAASPHGTVASGSNPAGSGEDPDFAKESSPFSDYDFDYEFEH